MLSLLDLANEGATVVLLELTLAGDGIRPIIEGLATAGASFWKAEGKFVNSNQSCHD